MYYWIWVVAMIILNIHTHEFVSPVYHQMEGKTWMRSLFLKNNSFLWWNLIQVPRITVLCLTKRESSEWEDINVNAIPNFNEIHTAHITICDIPLERMEVGAFFWLTTIILLHSLFCTEIIQPLCKCVLISTPSRASYCDIILFFVANFTFIVEFTSTKFLTAPNQLSK